MSQMINIQHLETDLWEAADNLRANSNLTAGENWLAEVKSHEKNILRKRN
jgi:L-rhamnose isomerase